MSMSFAVHVGFAKTGTTSLQRHLFSNHSQIEYLGKPFTDKAFETALHALMKEDSIAYKPGSPGLKEMVRARRDAAGESKTLVMISDEIFTSYSKVRDKGVVAQRIKETFEPDKIIITIRNQVTLLKSAYLTRGRMLMNVPRKFSGLTIGFGDWLDMSYESINRSYIEHVDFFKTVDYYSALFGKENVCVLLLEELFNEKEVFIEKLANFLDIDMKESLSHVQDAHENKGLTQALLDLELLRSRFYPLHNSLPVTGVLKLAAFFKKRKLKGVSAKVELPSGWTQRLKDLYGEGNRRLKEEYGLAVDSYGYPL